MTRQLAEPQYRHFRADISLPKGEMKSFDAVQINRSCQRGDHAKDGDSMLHGVERGNGFTPFSAGSQTAGRHLDCKQLDGISRHFFQTRTLTSQAGPYPTNKQQQRKKTALATRAVFCISVMRHK